MRFLAMPVLLLGLLPASASAASWGTVETVDRAGSARAVGSPAAAVSDRGVIVLSWIRTTSTARALDGARRTPRRGFGGSFRLRAQRGSLFENQVAFDPRGNALVSYLRLVRRNLRVETRTVRPNGGRTIPDLLSGAGESAYTPGFALSRGLEPLLVWNRRTTGRVQVSRARNGQLRDVDNLSLDGVDVFFAPNAQSPDGSLVTVGVRERALVLGIRPVGGDYAPAEPIPGTADGAAPAAGVRPDGSVVVVWVDRGTKRLMAVERGPRGGYSRPVALSPAGAQARDPRLAIASDGAARVVWRQIAARGGGADLMETTVGLDRGARRLNSSGEPVRDARIAADARGGATVLWRDATGNQVIGHLRTVTIDDTGRVDRVRRLTPRGEPASDFALAVGARGDALAAWATQRSERIRAVRRSATGG